MRQWHKSQLGKKWQLMELTENGKIEHDIITEFEASNPVKRVKRDLNYLLKYGIIFRLWDANKKGKNYYSGKWYKYQNGKLMEIAVSEKGDIL